MVRYFFLLYLFFFASEAVADTQWDIQAIKHLYQLQEGVLSHHAQFSLYRIHTQGFSDGALKLRAVYLPKAVEGEKASIGVDYPVGSIFSKTFFFERDADKCFSQGQLRVRLYNHENKQAPQLASIDLSQFCPVETRVLKKTVLGWQFEQYYWNEKNKVVERLPQGKLVNIYSDAGRFSYHVPGVTECMQCHGEQRASEDYGPIGFYQENLKTTPVVKKLGQQARAYLDVNCGYCHNPEGLAAASGLWLDRLESNLFRLGVCKRPVVASSTEAMFDIVPGHSAASWLVQRVKSQKSSVKMPELGRSLVDVYGSALIASWVNALEGDCP